MKRDSGPCLVALGFFGMLVIAAGPAPVWASQRETPGPDKTGVGSTNQVRELPPVPDGVTILRDVTFLPSDRTEKLDLYLPAKRSAETRSPGVVIIHGGGWTGGDKASAREFNIGTTLAKAGYVCASVEYLKKGPNRWPTNLKDCKNAVRFLRFHAKQYQVDSENIGVIGGSAGGHLALMVAYTAGVQELSPQEPYSGVSDEVKACVDLYGVANLLTRQGTAQDGTPNGQLREAGLFAEKRGENTEKWRMASPVSHVSSESPPTLIIHGTIDTTVDRAQSEELSAVLARNVVEHRLIMLPNVGHTFDLQSWQRKPLPEDLRPVVAGFFDRYLRKPRSRPVDE